MATISEKIDIGEKHKVDGNTHFKAQEYQKALSSYHLAILYLKGLDNSALELGLGSTTKPLDEDKKGRITKNMISTWSNMAACYLKLERYDKAVEICDKVLGMDPKNVKALFRKGQALFGRNDLDLAVKVLKSAALLEAKDPSIRHELIKVRERIAELDKKSNAELKQNLVKKMGQ
jgi:tetratricopeptide (TPR) repeat protein